MKVIDKKEQFIEYSKNHSLDEIAEHFNICRSYANLLRGQWCGIRQIRHTKTENIKKADFIKYKKSHTAQQTAEHYNVSKPYVYKLCVRFGLVSYRTKTETYIKNGHNITDEFPIYAKEHTAKECAEYFGVSISNLYWWKQKYNVETKVKNRTLKQVARVLYILDNGSNLFYFTNIDDIAQFIGLTKTRVTVLISKESKIHEYKVHKEKITSYRFQADKKRKVRNIYLDS